MAVEDQNWLVNILSNWKDKKIEYSSLLSVNLTWIYLDFESFFSSNSEGWFTWEGESFGDKVLGGLSLIYHGGVRGSNRIHMAIGNIL